MSTNSYPLLFTSTLLTGTEGLVYATPTVPPTLTLQDLTIKLTNVTNATATASVWAVPSGGVSGVTNAVVLDMSIPAKDFILIPVERCSAGSSINALASSIDAITIQAVTGKLHTI